MRMKGWGPSEQERRFGLRTKPHIRFVLGVWWVQDDETTVCSRTLAEAWEIWQECAS